MANNGTSAIHASTILSKPAVIKSKKRKTMAIALYLEGLGVRSVARIMKVSHVSVLNWIKLAANETAYGIQK